uniref:Uncharacterized protein n=1 Tax=Euplotes harpa TaxID=151035 RepID=A0A7S3JDJ9_9SPIT|mmetsp:Transcript_34382/g.39755  ORF Transcript_34382/g.39755 Transcript_34382/m.39755 type:complete len:154 (+) Transcript_34382:577-1038(+)
MITYNPDDRPSASQIIKHAYFKDLKELDDSKKGGATVTKGIALDNQSQYSRRNSDNVSEGGDSENSKSFNSKSKKKLDKFIKNPHQINFPPIKNPKDSKKKKKKSPPAEFKQSLKHNSSNHSITGKKIIPGVKRVANEHKKFYSPYSQRPAHK